MSVLSFLALACAVAARIIAERQVYGASAAPTQQNVVFRGPPGTRLCWVPSGSAAADPGACYEIGADRERRISSWPGHAFDVMRPSAEEGAAAAPPRVNPRRRSSTTRRRRRRAPRPKRSTRSRAPERRAHRARGAAACAGLRESWLTAHPAPRPSTRGRGAVFFLRARRERKPAAAAAAAAASPPATTHHAWPAFAVATTPSITPRGSGRARVRATLGGAAARAGTRLPEHWWFSALTLPAQLSGRRCSTGRRKPDDRRRTPPGARARPRSKGSAAAAAAARARGARRRRPPSRHALHAVVAQPLPRIEPHTLVTLPRCAARSRAARSAAARGPRPRRAGDAVPRPRGPRPRLRRAPSPRRRARRRDRAALGARGRVARGRRAAARAPGHDDGRSAAPPRRDARGLAAVLLLAALEARALRAERRAPRPRGRAPRSRPRSRARSRGAR